MKRTRLQITLLLLFTATANANWFTSLFMASQSPPTPEESGETLQNQYFVEFKRDWSDEQVEEAAKQAARQVGGVIAHVYKHVLKGALIVVEPSASRSYSARQGDQAVGDENEGPMFDLQPDVALKGDASPELRIQENPPRGLDRIDQRGLPLDGKFKSRYDGTGVNIYIFDTGIRQTHEEFDGRPPICGFDLFQYEGRCEDNESHGTHVAATAAGAKYGVAKNATLISIKVLDDNGDGSMGGLVAGLDYVVSEKLRNPDQPMVVNLSMGGAVWEPVNRAVEAAVDAGIVVVVAAGHNFSPACWESPASAPKAITVGASEPGHFFFFWTFERQAIYSNWGNCLDLYAPGSNIVSATIDNDRASTMRSGTSMAAPHVAGAAALYLQKHPTATPEEVRSAIINASSQWALMWIFQGWFSPNILLNVESL